MNRRIRKLLRKAGWSLVTAGTLGVTVPVTAQISALAPATGRQPAPARANELAAWVGENYARLTEMRVELAWLANPITFPYRLGARVNGLSLEVRGYVPNDGVRQHALRLAREETGLDVTDAMRIQPRMPLRSLSQSTETLQRDAVRALEELPAAYGSSMMVQARANGHVAVTGVVASYEDKLAVSRCLSRIEGCSGVVNALRVQPVIHEGAAYARVTADGKLLVPSEDTPTRGEPGTGGVRVVSLSELQAPVTSPAGQKQVPQEVVPVAVPVTAAPPPLQSHAPESPIPIRVDSTAADAKPKQELRSEAVTPSTPLLPAPATAPTPVRPSGPSGTAASAVTGQPMPALKPAAGRWPEDAAVQPAVPSAAPAEVAAPKAVAMSFPAAEHSPEPVVGPDGTRPAVPVFYQTRWRRPETAALHSPPAAPPASGQFGFASAPAPSTEVSVTTAGAPYVTTGVVLVEMSEPVPEPPLPMPTPKAGPETVVKSTPAPQPPPTPVTPPRSEAVATTHSVSGPALRPPAAVITVPKQQPEIKSSAAASVEARPPLAPSPPPKSEAAVKTGTAKATPGRSPYALVPRRTAEPASIPSGVPAPMLPPAPLAPPVRRAQAKSTPLPKAPPATGQPTTNAAERATPASGPAHRLPTPPKPETQRIQTLPNLPKPKAKAVQTLPNTPKPEAKAVQSLPNTPKPEAKAVQSLPNTPKPEPKLLDRRPEQPIVTTGVILLEMPVPPPPPPPAAVAPAISPVATRLKQRIQEVCGSGARDVEVIVRSATNVQIRLTARTDREGEQLSTKVFQLKELAPYQVSLDVQVVP